MEASLLSQPSSYPLKKENVLPVPITDYSLTVHQNKTAVEEIQNISTTSSLHVISLHTVPPFTKQILMSVTLMSDPSKDTHLTNHTILFLFFFCSLKQLTKWLLFVRSRQAFFISSAKSQPA